MSHLIAEKQRIFLGKVNKAPRKIVNTSNTEETETILAFTSMLQICGS
jgi:hypothetical protein